MKFVAAVAIMAGVDAVQRHHHHYPGVRFIQTASQGIDAGELQSGALWRNAWPQGSTDDSTDDDKIMNWMRAPAAPPAPIVYHDKMRQWQPNTWPTHFNWNGDMSHATYAKQIDDGTDDNEVVDLMTAQQHQ